MPEEFEEPKDGKDAVSGGRDSDGWNSTAPFDRVDDAIRDGGKAEDEEKPVIQAKK